MKNIFWKTCWYSNILSIVYIIIPFIFPDHFEQLISLLFLSTLGCCFFYSIGTLSFILWIYCIINFNNKTKKSIHLFFLILFSSLYVPIFYYRFFIKK
jgi:hypothetical protein